MTTFQLLARAALAAGAFLIASAHAADSGQAPAEPVASGAPLRIEDLFRTSSFGGAQLSPNGMHIGAIVADEQDARHLLILNLNGEKPAALRASERQEIVSFRWLDDERLIFNVSEDKRYTYGLYIADRHALRRHLPIDISYMSRIVGMPRQRPGHLIVTRRGSDGLVEVDVTKPLASWTERFARGVGDERTYKAPVAEDRILWWDADADGELALCGSYDKERFQLHRYLRESDNWQDLAIDDKKYRPIAADLGGDHLWVVDHDALEGYRLRTFHYSTGALGEPVARDAIYDLGEAFLYFSRKSRTLAGIAYTQRRVKNLWFSEPFASTQRLMDQRYPEMDNTLVDFNEAETRFLFRSTSDREPGLLTLVDVSEKTTQRVTQVAPWLESERLLPTQPISFKARDGLKLEGYLTLPTGASKEHPKPLVVLVHGGPTVRDAWTFDPEVQFLASRGYAVLQPNYRGSTGYAPAISREERLDFRRMHDDVTDATRAMIKTGLIDEKRVAIMGASFGGYLAVAGVAFEPGLYRCAVSNCGVFDWSAMMRSEKSSSRTVDYERLIRRFGDPRENRERFQEASPLAHADKIRVPVLIAHGKEDNVVDVEQSKKLAAALKSRGVPHETFFRRFEGHGFYNYENRVEFYRTVEKFLAKHLAAESVNVATR